MKPGNPTIRLAALLVCAALLALSLGVPAEAVPGPSAPIVRVRKIAPGLKYIKIAQRQIPRRTFILRIDLSKAITLDTTIADAALPSRRALSDIVRSAGALTGVNGDYGPGPGEPGFPLHPFAQDGELLHTGKNLGPLFAVTRDESEVIFARPKMRVTVTDRSNGRVFTLDRWNRGAPMTGELVGFSPLGGTLQMPPPFACSARLLPEGPLTVADPDGIERGYTVDVVQCSAESLARKGGIVLSAAPASDEATQLLAIAPGTRMRFHWTFGWANVFDAVGGAPMLLEAGSVVGQCNSACGRNPRTAVGVTSTGRILLVVIDGRQPRWSVGASMGELARIMADLGAVTALNLDGGGSSEMVVEGEVVNRPSDGHERPITNAILVLPGPDPDEP